jgi:hypothetical protein
MLLDRQILEVTQGLERKNGIDLKIHLMSVNNSRRAYQAQTFTFALRRIRLFALDLEDQLHYAALNCFGDLLFGQNTVLIQIVGVVTQLHLLDARKCLKLQIGCVK